MATSFKFIRSKFLLPILNLMGFCVHPSKEAIRKMYAFLDRNVCNSETKRYQIYSRLTRYAELCPICRHKALNRWSESTY